MGTVEIRVRSIIWLATAAFLGVAGTLIVTSAWSTEAAPGDIDSTFVPTAGCRLVDTRSDTNIGPRTTPLGAGDILEIDVHGSNGECTGPLAIPTDAVGVALNVTAVNATAPSNLRFYPADLTDVPLLSNLNVTAGAPPIPNKVDVELSSDGAIKVFNSQGTVDLVFDTVGYYTNATLQELGQRVTDLETAAAELDAAQPFAVTNQVGTAFADSVEAPKISVTVDAAVDGQVTVNSGTQVDEDTAGDEITCSITTDTTLDFDYLQWWESPGPVGGFNHLAGTRTFDISGGTSATYHLVCQHLGASENAVLVDLVLTAIFTPAP